MDKVGAGWVVCRQPLRPVCYLTTRGDLSRQSLTFSLGTTLLIDPEHYGLRMMTL